MKAQSRTRAKTLSRKSVTRFRIAPLSLTMLMIFSACASDANNETLPRSPDANEGTDTGDTTAVPEEADRIVFVHTISGDSMDPDRTPGGAHVPLLQPAYDRLIHVNQTTTELIPGLAEEWERLENNTILELRLRKGVVFHDGQPFNAEAVRANIERSQTLADAFDEVRRASVSIERVEVLDEFRVRLHRKPDQDLAWALLEGRLSENLGMMISPAAITDDRDLVKNPSGAGPWKIKSFEREKIIFERFDRYWDTTIPVSAHLEIHSPKDASARLSGILTGEYNIVRLAPEDFDRANADAKIGLELVNSTTVMNLYLNHSRGALKNSELRRAFLHGIDRPGIVKALYQDFGSPTVQTFPPGYFAADPNLTVEAYPYDPELARSLVVEAGFEDGVVLKALVLDVYTSLWEVVQEQMAQVGVTIDLVVVETSRWAEYLGGDYDLYIGSRSRLDPLDILEVSLDENGFFNPGGLIPEIQSLLEYAATLTAPERVGIVREISRIATEEGYLHTFFSFQEVWAVRCVDGFEPPIYAGVDFRGAKVSEVCN